MAKDFATPAQIKAAQDVLGCYRDLCIHGAMADGVCPRARNVANRVVAADREQAALQAEVERLQKALRGANQTAEMWRRESQKAEAAVARVRAMAPKDVSYWWIKWGDIEEALAGTDNPAEPHEHNWRWSLKTEGLMYCTVEDCQAKQIVEGR